MRNARNVQPVFDVPGQFDREPCKIIVFVRTGHADEIRRKPDKFIKRFRQLFGCALLVWRKDFKRKRCLSHKITAPL